jgi:hypothetical protein
MGAWFALITVTGCHCSESPSSSGRRLDASSGVDTGFDDNGNPIRPDTGFDDNGNPIPPDTGFDDNGNPIPPDAGFDDNGNPIPPDAGFDDNGHPIRPDTGFDDNGNPLGVDAGSGDASITDAGSSIVVVTCPGCPCFPGTNCASGGNADGGAPPACPVPGEAPTIIYPPDRVLMPPNTNSMEVQFLRGAGNTLFEIDFQNAVTDVRMITRCSTITDTRGVLTAGCGYTLDTQRWQYVASVNRGGDPVHVTVRATPDGVCVGSSATRQIEFATEDLVGAIYYWQSVTVSGVPGKAGGIYRYDFGRADIAPEAFLQSNATNGNRCVGCHFVSRDGQRLSYGSDDPDSDDEYGDLSSRLMDVATRNVLSTSIVPGFRTFTHDHAWMLASDGRGMANPPAFRRYDANSAMLIDSPATGTRRGTQPDWSPDDSTIVYVQPGSFLQNNGGASMMMGDDSHFIGGSLFTKSWNGTITGPPTALLMSTGENNYYPAFSSDGSFILFNRVFATTGTAADAFANPNARIWAMSRQGGTPVDLAVLNRANHLSNSWPRWSPYVQRDRGHSILWVTFSSTRDYGLRVQNEDPAGVACFPPESPENQNTSHQCPLVPATCGCTALNCPTFCVQPQIWMAAVEVDATGGISAGRDTSHPGFWLPFQDVTAHNHIAQWVSSIPGSTTDAGVTDGSSSDAATCGFDRDPCGPGHPLCCATYVCLSGQCTAS